MAIRSMSEELYFVDRRILRPMFTEMPRRHDDKLKFAGHSNKLTIGNRQ